MCVCFSGKFVSPAETDYVGNYFSSSGSLSSFPTLEKVTIGPAVGRFHNWATVPSPFIKTEKP